MLIKKVPDIRAAEITPQRLYLRRREFIQAAGLTAAAALAGVPGVRGVSQDAGATGDLAAYVIDADAHPRVAEAAAAALVAGGLGLVEMGPAPVDLEALFLGLTGGRPGDRP